MGSTQITERQRYWRDHVLAAASHDGSIVAYAAANGLKTRDLYQWKAALTKRGFLSAKKAKPHSEFAEVKVSAKPASAPSSRSASAHCRLTLPCGSIVEYFDPVDPESLSQLLAGLR